ncbi:MAG: DUF3822 family protein [Chitinophagaceae bacterium]|uniref:DUF3822 family protein n=1 Tax=unclassified Paraflavitalea TaxID=2798305 RepID=UPI003D352D10|nr:DUF3822 family protein [Chitinophagaceae bacterium]
MIKPVIDIKIGEVMDSDRLWTELGEHHFTAVWLNTGNQKVQRWLHCEIDTLEGITVADQLKQFWKEQSDLDHTRLDVIIAYNFMDVHLLPDHLLQGDGNKAVTDALLGSANRGLVLVDKNDSFQTSVLYKIPREIHSFFQTLVKPGKYWHIQSLFMQSDLLHMNQGKQLYLVFYHGRVLIRLYNNGQPMIIQMYEYQQPEDISWYLLSVCHFHQVSLDQVSIKVSGMIQQDSVLYSELNKYFRIELYTETGQYFDSEDGSQDYPSHYFSPILSMSTCVS